MTSFGIRSTLSVPVGLGNSMQYLDLHLSLASRSWMIVGRCLLSMSYRLVCSLLGLIDVLVRRDLSKDAELLVLRHENVVMRRQIARVRDAPAARAWLAALSRLLPRYRWASVFPVTPATILTWHRRLVSPKWDYIARRRPGRPLPQRRSKSSSSAWQPRTRLGRRRRVQGELVRLGHRIAATTVWQILHDAGLDPAPCRSDPTWRQFLTAQAKTILGSLSDLSAAAEAAGVARPLAGVEGH